MSSGINGIADDLEKHPLQSLTPAPVVDMVALETVLMEPLEESPAPIVDMVALKAVLMAPLEEPPAPIVDMVALKAVLMEPLEELPAPIVDMVALKAVLTEPFEEPRAGLDKLAALLKALPYAQMLALGASIWAAKTPRTRLTQEILPEVLYRWALTRAPSG